MRAQSTNALVVAQKAVRRIAAGSLPIKWRAEAPIASTVPTYAEAIVAFRKEFELNRLGIVQIFHLRTSRIAVYGCKLAVEYSNRKTLHLRMRPPGSPWLLTAEIVSAWPELDSYIGFRSLDYGWLRVALANIFEAWSQSWLPAGYRYADPLYVVDTVLNDLFDTDRVAQQWERALQVVLPREFLRVMDMAPVPLAALPGAAAPFRVWNHHAAELEQLRTAAPWLRQIVPMLKYFPAELPLGANLEHSLRTMVMRRHSPAVWRFHRRSEFCLVPAGDLLLRGGAGIVDALVTSAVKALGLDGAVAFLEGLGADRFTRMYIELNEQVLPERWRDLLALFMARAAARMKTAAALDECEVVGEQIILVLRGLARAGFAEEFPTPNSTWNSLVQRAEGWNVPEAPELEASKLPESWATHMKRWECGNVRFDALTSLKELRVEGVQMVHCIESRHAACAVGVSVVYRISGALPNGQPVRATVEFARTPAQTQSDGQCGKWHLHELKGRHNAAVDPALKHIALGAAGALNRAG